jgi:predicted NAD/FAD-binding protein
MPKIKMNWSSWNYIKKDDETFTVYWMNRLQPNALAGEKNIFININGISHIDPQKVIKKITYTHPLFDVAAIKSQAELAQMNKEVAGLNFCGSYFRYGFHEDALMSAVNLCSQLLSKEVL